MSGYSFLILPSVPGGDALWLDENPRRISLDNLSELAGRSAILVLPGQMIRTVQTDLPKAARAQQLKMARFANEDKIASAPELLHFALSEDQPPRVAIVDTAWLRACLDGVAEAGIFVRSAFADYDLLPSGQRIALLDRVVEGGPFGAALDPDWVDAPTTPVTDTDIAQLMSDRLDTGEALDVMQGDFRARANSNLPKPALWRAGGLLAACLVAGLIWSGLQSNALNRQAANLRAQTAADFTALTGQVAPDKPGLAAARLVRSGADTSGDFLTLSRIMFDTMAGLEGVSVERVSFNAQRGELQMRLVYPDFDAAARVEAAARNAGGTFVTGGVRETNGQFIGEATLRAGGAS